jgi:cytochrome P450
MFLINRDPELWENPSVFNPDRFDGKQSADFTSAKNGFSPFGYGSRTCIGNTLAQLESTIFFCHLLRKFRVEEQPGFKPNIMSGISLTTTNGIHVKLVPRA